MSKTQYFYGIHTIKALLDTQAGQITTLYVGNRADQRVQALVQQAERAAVVIKRASRHELQQLVNSKQHQGIVAECQGVSSFNESALESLLQDNDGPVLLLILDGVQDPHNLGACLRSANAFGVCAVIAPKDRAVGMTATVAKAACGAEAVTPFIQATNLARTMRWLQEQGIWLVGTVADVDTPISELDLTGHIAVVLGSEGQGMRCLTQNHCDFLAQIPMWGSVASLNVSVATAVCLYEVQRQRSKAGPKSR